MVNKLHQKQVDIQIKVDKYDDDVEIGDQLPPSITDIINDPNNNNDRNDYEEREKQIIKYEYLLMKRLKCFLEMIYIKTLGKNKVRNKDNTELLIKETLKTFKRTELSIKI